MMSGSRPGFNFQVEWGDTRHGFSEVSGLGRDLQVANYRVGKSNDGEVSKRSTIPKFGHITLKRGLITDAEFLDWCNEAVRDAGERRDLTIRLLDEEQRTVSSWTVQNALPTRVAPADLNAGANEIAIETLELTHEGIRALF